jgi:hypothetical protein
LTVILSEAARQLFCRASCGRAAESKDLSSIERWDPVDHEEGFFDCVGRTSRLNSSGRKSKMCGHSAQNDDA